jgi:hypothetical protein
LPLHARYRSPTNHLESAVHEPTTHLPHARTRTTTTTTTTTHHTPHTPYRHATGFPHTHTDTQTLTHSTLTHHARTQIHTRRTQPRVISAQKRRLSHLPSGSTLGWLLFPSFSPPSPPRLSSTNPAMDTMALNDSAISMALTHTRTMSESSAVDLDHALDLDPTVSPGVESPSNDNGSPQSNDNESPRPNDNESSGALLPYCVPS